MSVVSVHFDGQFWAGILEVHQNATIQAARHVFGPEPSDAELAAFCAGPLVDRLFDRAYRSPAIPMSGRPTPLASNPKRRARQAAKEARRPLLATRAQDAVRIAREAEVREQAETRRNSHNDDDDRYLRRKERRRKRHRGR